MSEEARIHVSTGFGGGISVNLRADNATELEQLIADAQLSSPTLARLMQQAGVTLPDQQAVAVVQQTFPQAQVVQTAPVSTVGQAPAYQPAVVAQPVMVQQQTAVQQPAQSNQNRIPGPAGAPPGITYPGPCNHGDRVYNDKPARGKAWQRWECNIPWSRNAQGRCESINV